jgi:RNA polymerase sigma factor (sigma-70 family)
MLAPDLELLLERCRRREPGAQRALYARYAPTMLGVARRYARSLEEAEDILQDAFVKVFTRLDSFRAEGSLEGWIRRVVVTTALSAYERDRNLRRAQDIETAYHLSSPDADALEKLSVEEVFRLIDQLPDGCRVVLLLYTVDGYAHAEIAEMLGITESTSKAQLSKARSRLVQLVQAEHNHRPR